MGRDGACNGYSRRPTRTVRVGRVGIGSEHPICPQSMTTSRARDVEASLQQCQALADAGAALVRITAPQIEDARALPDLVANLAQRGIGVPIVADVHFNPDVAYLAGQHVAKVRINPGNYSDAHEAASEQAYREALASMAQRMAPLLDVCRRHSTALRVGVNHGSLAPRVVHRYGAGAEGMVISALEVVEIARAQGFHNLVVSLKASDPRMMIAANRLLAASLDERGWDYPIHLGVTEAGAGEDGRVKSALGIGTLLADGIGDTIRVSLTESPVEELPVCRSIIERVELWASTCGERVAFERSLERYDALHPARRAVEPLHALQGKGALLVLIAEDEATLRGALAAEAEGIEPFDLILYSGAESLSPGLEGDGRLALPQGSDAWRVPGGGACIAQRGVRQVCMADTAEALGLRGVSLLVLKDESLGPWGVRLAVDRLARLGVRLPVVLRKEGLPRHSAEGYSTVAAMECGSLLIDNLVEGLASVASADAVEVWRQAGYAILQASGLRRTKADYIACPGCGRTLFDLQGTLARVQAATQHLRHLRIGVMGCIVNGPGEMAGADYGYVGAGPGRITLYKGQTAAKRSIPEADAIEALVDLIKAHGDWRERT